MEHEPEEEQLSGTRQMFNVIHSEQTTSTLFSEDIVLDPVPTSSPNDPLNWSTARKWLAAFLPLFYTAFSAATSNDAGSGGDELVAQLNISYAVQNTAAGVLFIGIGYWTLLASPMPVLYGRRLQYFSCLTFSIIGAVWYAKTRTVQDAIWNQLFVGASESAAEALVQQSLSDLFFQHQRGLALGLYVLATSIGTFLGPLCGGYIADWRWRWIGWWSAIISVGTLAVFYFGLEETTFHRDLFLGRRPASVDISDTNEATAEKVRDDKAPPIERASPSIDATDDLYDPPKTYWQRIAIITPAPNLIGLGIKQYFQRLYQTMRVFMFPAVIYAGLQWGAQDSWLSFYLTVQEDNWYDAPWFYSNAQVAIMNVPTLIGAVIGCVWGGWFSDYFVQWMAKRRGGLSEAEDRLWLAIPSALINPAGLMLFGIGSAKGWSWPVPYVGLGMIGFGWGCAGDLSMAYLVDCYPDMVLEGMVGVAVINNTLASIFTFTTSDWLNASGLQNTFIAIGILAFAIQMLVLPMMYYGKNLRRRTAQQYRKFLYIRDGR